MHGILTIFRKEMEDQFSSTRFLLISALIVMVGGIVASMVGMAIKEEVRGLPKPTLLFLTRNFEVSLTRQLDDFRHHVLVIHFFVPNRPRLTRG